jgi:hypothetical protein
VGKRNKTDRFPFQTGLNTWFGKYCINLVAGLGDGHISGNIKVKEIKLTGSLFNRT